MLEQRNTDDKRSDRNALAGTPPTPQHKCSCGGYVRKTTDPVYQDHFYQCMNCGREYSQPPTQPLDTPEVQDEQKENQLPATPLPDPFQTIEPPHAQETLTSMRWPQGVRCVNCRSYKVRTISPPPQLGFACDSCHSYFDHRTKTLLENHRVADEAWIDLIERTVALKEAPTQYEVASLTLLNLNQARQLQHDIIRAVPHPDSGHTESDAEFRRLLIESGITPATRNESTPTSSIIQLDQPALPIMEQDQAPAHILASLRWPNGIPCDNCADHNFRYMGSPTQGEYTCRHCERNVNLRSGSILANTNHGLGTWLNALRVLFTSPITPQPDELARIADIAPSPAQSIAERFQRILPLWEHSPSPNITVGAVSQFLNIPRPSERGRQSRKHTQPSASPETTPATGELSPMTTDNTSAPRVMPEYHAKTPATIEVATMRWPNGLHCPFCQSYDCINMNLDKAPQPFQCRACRRNFSTRTNSVLSVNSVPAKFWIPLIRHVATHPDLPDALLAATISGTEERHTQRMLSAIADVMERWPYVPSPDVNEAQIAELLNISLSREHPAQPEKVHRKKKDSKRSAVHTANPTKKAPPPTTTTSEAAAQDLADTPTPDCITQAPEPQIHTDLPGHPPTASVPARQPDELPLYQETAIGSETPPPAPEIYEPESTPDVETPTPEPMASEQQTDIDQTGLQTNPVAPETAPSPGQPKHQPDDVTPEPAPPAPVYHQPDEKPSTAAQTPQDAPGPTPPPLQEMDFNERLNRIEARLEGLKPALDELTAALQPPEPETTPKSDTAAPTQPPDGFLRIPGLHEYLRNRNPHYRCGPHHATG